MKKISIKNNTKSFTIIELLTAIFIVALLTAILSVVFNVGLKIYKQGDEIVEISNIAQRFLGQISSELRGAIVSDNPVEVPFIGQQSAIGFVAPWDNASDVELCEFGYSLSGNLIVRHFVTDSATIGFEYPDSDINLVSGGAGRFVEFKYGGTLRFIYVNSNGSMGNSWNSTLYNPPELPQRVFVRITINDSRGISYPFTTQVFLTNSTNN